MATSAYLRAALLDHVFKGVAYSMPSAIYLSLHTADPGTTGASEASGGGYARVAVAPGSAWTRASNVVSNTSQVTWPTSTGAISSGAALTFFGVWDASSGGNFLFGGTVSSPVGGLIVGSASIAPFASAGALTVTET